MGKRRDLQNQMFSNVVRDMQPLDLFKYFEERGKKQRNSEGGDGKSDNLMSKFHPRWRTMPTDFESADQLGSGSFGEIWVSVPCHTREITRKKE